MLKLVTISHNDLDGYGSSMISFLMAKHHSDHLQVIEQHNIGNQDVDSTVLNALDAHADDPNVYIVVTDLSTSEVTTEEISKRLQEGTKCSIHIFDHHKSADYLNKYPFADMIVADTDGELQSGSSLVHDIFFGEILKMFVPSAITYFAEMVRVYDTWEWTKLNNPLPKELNDLLYLIGPSKFKREIMDIILRAVEREDYSFTPSVGHKLLLENERERIAAYINKKEKQAQKESVDFEGRRYDYMSVYAEQYQSELGNELAKRFPDADFVLMVDMGSKKISVRSNKNDVDLSVIAKAHGGGGHAPSAGFPLTALTLRKFVEGI